MSKKNSYNLNSLNVISFVKRLSKNYKKKMAKEKTTNIPLDVKIQKKELVTVSYTPPKGRPSKNKTIIKPIV